MTPETMRVELLVLMKAAKEMDENKSPDRINIVEVAKTCGEVIKSFSERMTAAEIITGMIAATLAACDAARKT